ncbi:MAG: LLM class flavin-dependent oxidoreductase [Gammaproteobacteria bacterium]|nr:LLM class flavin-dependent oxidoreductase [Gammaproteobacteria bacterium]MBQ0840753.1 LLM class flavin-dependent oxidoreductase [Gammaproteobacteria bacterium]
MKVGLSCIFQNPWNNLNDHDVYQHEVRIASQAEALGYDSIWGVEHHFTGYTMCPDVMQWLSFIAGKTEKVGLGSMAVILPWHDPVRVAEEISMLDNLSNGRAIIGFGRGLARVEFDTFGLNQGEARETFMESAKMICEGLEQGYCELDGDLIKQPKAPIRPAPIKTFKGRSYAASMSPDSILGMAELGLGLLVIPHKPWDEVSVDMAKYRELFIQLQGVAPPAPIAAGWTYCHEDAGAAEEAANKYITGYWQSVIDHYEMNKDYFKKRKGYEYYGDMSDVINDVGRDSIAEMFKGLQVWGTPEQCYQKIVDIRSQIGNNGFNGVFTYADMPFDMAEKSFQLFSKEVLPELQKIPDVEDDRQVA